MNKILFLGLLSVCFSVNAMEKTVVESNSQAARISTLFDNDGAHFEIPENRKVILRLSNSIIEIAVGNSFDSVSSVSRKDLASRSQLRPSLTKQIRKSQRDSKPTQKYAAYRASLKR